MKAFAEWGIGPLESLLYELYYLSREALSFYIVTTKSLRTPN